VQREFGKQLGNLLRDLRHHSLQAKKYDAAQGIWQARVKGGWRFCFRIEEDLYHLLDITPHPK
jgi:plasmid maintenance system killer protein